MIQDSGNRKTFDTGAVRDMPNGKGRCDLMPLDVVGKLINSAGIVAIAQYQETKDVTWLYRALLDHFVRELFDGQITNMLLEVSAHFEEGAAKYGEDNWRKGIPIYCYIDSAVRHYLKWRRGDADERHDRAVTWNLMCAIWTAEHLDQEEDYPFGNCPNCKKEFNSELINEYDIDYCPWCGAKIEED